MTRPSASSSQSKCPHRGYRVAVVFPKCSLPHANASSSPRRAAPWVVRLAVAPPAGPAEVAAGGRSLLSDHALANDTIAGGDGKAFERIFVQSLAAAVKPLIIERVEEAADVEATREGEASLPSSLETEEEAWSLLKKAVVEYCGSPVETGPSLDDNDDHIELEAETTPAVGEAMFNNVTLKE